MPVGLTAGLKCIHRCSHGLERVGMAESKSCTQERRILGLPAGSVIGPVVYNTCLLTCPGPREALTAAGRPEILGVSCGSEKSMLDACTSEHEGSVCYLCDSLNAVKCHSVHSADIILQRKVVTSTALIKLPCDQQVAYLCHGCPWELV